MRGEKIREKGAEEKTTTLDNRHTHLQELTLQFGN
jgi:hypothetical protein